MSVRLGSLVLVSGDTYQHRDKIKDIGGGTWCKPLTGWIFPESQRTDVQVALAMPEVSIGSAVLVSGDTYQHRDKIKDIGGGTWCKPLTGWIFPESKRADVQAALASLCGSTSAGSTSAEKPAEADLGEEAEEGDETGKTGTGGMPSPAAPSSIAPSSNAASPSVAPTGATSAASPSRNAGAALTLVKHKRAIVVKGDTFKVKEQLGALKGSWNRTLGGWVFQGSRKDEILSLLRADGTNVVSDETDGTTDGGSTSAEQPVEATQGNEAGTSGMPSPAAPSSIAPSSNAASPSVAPTGATSAASPSRNAGAALTLVKHKRAIVVKGDTFKVKEQLGALKGSWNRTLGGWVFQGSRKDEILSLLRADGTNVVSDETGGAAPSSPAKRPRADSSEPGQAAEAERDWDAEYKKGRDKLGQEHGFNNFDDFVDDYIVRARKRQEKKADRTAILMSGACMYGVGWSDDDSD